MEESIKFSEINRNIDTNILVINPNKDELSASSVFYKRDDANVFFNIEPERITKFYDGKQKPKYPWSKVILIDNEGHLLNELKYSGSMYNAIPSFFEECAEIINQKGDK